MTTKKKAPKAKAAKSAAKKGKESHRIHEGTTHDPETTTISEGHSPPQQDDDEE